MPCLLMCWRLYEPVHHQAWYWPVSRSRLTSDRGLDLLGGPDLIGGTYWPRSRYSVQDPTKLHRHTYGVILETWFWLVNAGECPQQYILYEEIGITPQECSLLPRHLRNLCLEIRCCEIRCLDFVFDEGLRMVFDDDNFLIRQELS